MTAREAVIVATARTPIGRAFKGSLVDVRPDDLSGLVIAELLTRVPALDPASVDDVIWGAAIQHGEQSMNLGRNVAALAGLPETVPGTTVNRFCASSLQAIRMAFHAIMADEGDAFIAGGVESTTRASIKGFDPEDMNPRFTDESRADFVNHMYIPMGLTAENVADRYGVTREAMDAYAVISQERAVAAQERGFFDAETIAVTTPSGNVVRRDDGPRPNTTLEVLATLKPAFRPDGRVTAGNSCPLNDGAAGVIVMERSRAEALGIRPLAKIVASAVTGIAPEIMGVGPIDAVRAVLERAGLTIGDIDVVELNEAFAAQVLPVVKETGISIDHQLNPNGGAIALGHPFGMTGARIMTTLLHELDELGARLGLETMCVGGGQGMAMIVERLD
ncbi:acetyl-CoA acetyltransferase [Acidimicrobium ferrooxidans DSM 10331]|uniref:Acetyl-CoA acetyltransferase n=1 Tax=Acidimicrobium ferrooxidans (strain DSM 10331 / JCM 15462 / NBRC 103882 / ICP) TaxID=525909 RepID=C7M2I6_ACIFD|nr:acetyl-CoA C-acyltransferase [Acidimicrobium ferrooxidans]ACU53230.1 acetyl-CoA acetyltransferase [Acidimicrobium ferrooxidans DSM 10331]